MLEVVKVGGSLFSGTDFPPRLLSWLSSRPSAYRVLIAGGGESADLVREWAARFHLQDGPSHWLAVQAMELQSALAAALLGLPECGSFDECRMVFEAGESTVLLRPLFELRSESKAVGETLPESWDVTSDSIAAWAAKRIGADRLVLLKSVGGEQVRDLDAAAALGWVDPHFAHVVETPTLWVDLPSGREWECEIDGT